MATMFLLIIYLAFISLGLPDSILGAAWPIMRTDLNAPLSAAGLVSMIVSASTIVSSLNSSRLLRRFGTGMVSFLSTLLTAAALFGFSFSGSILFLLVLAVPLGLGAGAIDAGLNNYVALHYQARHMNWLHCFWGIGATLGPAIMSAFLHSENWRGGYRTIAGLQFLLVLILLAALPAWRKHEQSEQASQGEESTARDISIRQLLSLRGAKPAMAAFFFYCASEITLGLWGSSFLVEVRGIPAAQAALWVSVYYGGITVGRGIAGFVSMKLTNRQLIRAGQLISLAGAVLLLLPLPKPVSCAALLLIGMGYAPIYPAMLHETPARFGRANSQQLMGLQMALAYTGSTLAPSLIGAAAGLTSIVILPFFLAGASFVMLLCCERVNRLLAAGKMGGQ